MRIVENFELFALEARGPEMAPVTITAFKSFLKQ
jgi:hypothetical protein